MNEIYDNNFYEQEENPLDKITSAYKGNIKLDERSSSPIYIDHFDSDPDVIQASYQDKLYEKQSNLNLW